MNTIILGRHHFRVLDDQILQEASDIPGGTDCVTLLPDQFLCIYAAEFMSGKK